MTNRKWLATLSSKELSEFFTIGLCVKRCRPIAENMEVISIKDISSRYTLSAYGIEAWLESSQEFEVIKGA